MSLYGQAEDISLFRHLNRELINSIISQEVGYYKIALAESETNIYGESTKKLYYQPVLLNCIINRTDPITNDTDFGPDAAQTVTFAFLRDDLLLTEIVPEVGDIILANENYYEVDNVNENQFIVGKYPEYAISQPTQNFGSSWSVTCETHLTRPAKLNIAEQRL
jgi:hypothetical protein